MAKVSKFGAFNGVFTPSILTILGVIMYMRLGWVTGQAGLLGALAIVFVSHIISIATGLSIASIATDKKIKIGGIYYMLSRSLGLPMGGAIGIALFIGTSLSISLYIIGFVESFLSIQEIREFLHLEQEINDYKIAGTAVIIFLVLVAFISTSLAIKTQFLILAFIVLSLISIFVGAFVNPTFTPNEVALMPMDGDVKMSYVFAIFFPAVTGFTAGVAMSGDLKDPRKNIPVGTLSSIIVGMIVYVSLVVLFGLFVDRDVLINNTDFLMTFAWSVPLLVAGIWGATLSSALGGILGGPRILQALSKDKILWKIFGKGYGKNNEPRNALIATFLIAEAGILIGELNTVARIVSMFYLASYGFINLAYSLESWASTDFRPSFRIPRGIGIIGFIASVLVMLFLDMMSMILALIIMLAIYSVLKRKELKLDFGDVWQSVWTSIIRIGLHRMDNQDIEERNWQPNVILFSGGTNRRPHLIDFGKFLVGKHGMLSNFDLIEVQDASVLFPKHQQSIPDDEETNRGVFTRQQSCKDFYEGMEMIARVYGFSGVEPNTVLMGWAKGGRNPERFVESLKTMSDLDLNIILLDYSKQKGFGKLKQIDIWWRGGGNNGNFAISLSKFILNTNEWRDASLRLIIVNQVNDQKETIQKKAETVIENLRIQATVKIINNQIEQRSFYDIIRTESGESDLVFLGIPDLNTENAFEFVDSVNKLVEEIGTVALISASSHFKSLNLGEQPRFIKYSEQLTEGISVAISEKLANQQIDLPKNKYLAEKVSQLLEQFNQLNLDYHQHYIYKIVKTNDHVVHSFDEMTDKIFALWEDSKGVITQKKAQLKLLAKVQNSFLIRARKLIIEIQENVLDGQTDLLREGIEHTIKFTDEQFSVFEKTIEVDYTLDDLKHDKSDDLQTRSFKFNKRLQIRTTGKPVKYTIYYKKLLDKHLPLSAYEEFYQMLKQWGLFSFQFVIEVQKFIRNVRNIFMLIEREISEGKISSESIADEKMKVKRMVKNLDSLNLQAQEKLYAYAVNHSTEVVNKINTDLKKVNVNQYIKKPFAHKRKVKDLKNLLLSVPGFWSENQNLIYNASTIEIMLHSLENKLRRVINDITIKFSDTVNNTVLNHLKDFDAYLNNYIYALQDNPNTPFEPGSGTKELHKDNYYLIFKEIIDVTYRNIKNLISKFPETIEIMDDDSFNDFEKLQYENVEVVQLSVSRMLDFLIQSEIIAPLQSFAEDLPDKLVEADSFIFDVIRLISFSTAQPDFDQGFEQDELYENLLPFIKEQKEKVEAKILEITRLKNGVKLEVVSRMSQTIDLFSVYNLRKVALNMKQYIQEQGTKKRIEKVSGKVKKIKHIYTNKASSFLFKKSEAVLLAKQQGTVGITNKTPVDKILDLVDFVSVNDEIIEKLPFYYQQLFLRKHNYYKEFWFDREKEMELAKTAIKRYNSGYFGGLLIEGFPDSGRTFFSHYLATEINEGKNTYVLNPPLAGTTKAKQFKAHLQKAFGLTGNYQQIFNNLSSRSILIIDDLELWWEKSEEGFEVLDIIIDLIDKYSEHCLFIVNVNRFAYQLINKTRNLSQYFLNVISCEPFNVESLREIILFRHQSSGLKLEFNQRSEEDIRSTDYANIFLKHFNYSKGNIGTALLSWISNIQEFSDNIIKIELPKIPDSEVLNGMETDVYLLLVQFFLHKRLTIEKLMRISLEDKEYLSKKINYLKRCGLVIEESQNIFELNSYIIPVLQEKLLEKELL